MKIALIEPPQVEAGNISRFYANFGTSKADFAWPPLELMSIAGYLKKFEIKTVIYDAGSLRKNFNNVREFIAKENPDMVIFSTSTNTINWDVLTASEAKKVSKDIITAAVGSHIMTQPEETLKLNSDLDVCIYSDDEEIIAKNLANSITDLSDVKGICYKTADGAIKKNHPQEGLSNLDELGFPAHDQIQKEIYYDFSTKRTPLTLVMPQRGCVNKCMFCLCPAIYQYRKRSVLSIIEELKWIKELGYKEFKFISSGITHDLNWANNLMDEIIKNKLDLTWWANIRADKVNHEILNKMKNAGCHTLAIGMESTDPEILKTIGKNVTPEQVKAAVILAKKIGLRASVYFILGLPGETKETIKKTISFAKSLPADFITMGVAQPLPGTEFYSYLKKNNFLLTDDWEKYDPVQPPVYQYPHLSSKEIFEATRSGYQQFYLRPSYILEKALQIRSLEDLKNGFKNFSALIKRYVLR